MPTYVTDAASLHPLEIPSSFLARQVPDDFPPCEELSHNELREFLNNVSTEPEILVGCELAYYFFGATMPILFRVMDVGFGGVPGELNAARVSVNAVGGLEYNSSYRTHAEQRMRETGYSDSCTLGQILDGLAKVAAGTPWQTEWVLWKRSVESFRTLTNLDFY